MAYPAFWRNGKKTCRAVRVLHEHPDGYMYHVEDAKSHKRFSVVRNEITSYVPMGCRVTNL